VIPGSRRRGENDVSDHLQGNPVRIRGVRFLAVRCEAGRRRLPRAFLAREDGSFLLIRAARALAELQIGDCFSTCEVKSQSLVCTSRWLPYRGEFYFICGGRVDRLIVRDSCSRDHQVVFSKTKPPVSQLHKRGSEVSASGLEKGGRFVDEATHQRPRVPSRCVSGALVCGGEETLQVVI